MEKPTAKPKKKVLNFIPKAAQAATISFQNLPFSPGRDRLRAHHSKGFSGPILSSMIPPEARGRSKNFETQEPTSPKVSCMGQIKLKKKCKKKPEKSSRPEKTDGKSKTPAVEPKEKPSGRTWKLFGPGRKSHADIVYNPPQRRNPALGGGAPGIGQLRKFASSRESFANFDWTAAAQIAPEEDRRDFGDSDEDDVIIPFSAPILMGGDAVAPAAAESRKEINLWKRRTMTQPKPLQLNKIGSKKIQEMQKRIPFHDTWPEAVGIDGEAVGIGN